MSRSTLILFAVLAVGCLPADPSDADDAQEAVVRHFAERVEGGPWEVICLRRDPGTGQEDEATYLRRFEGHPLPVVPEHCCKAAGAGSFDWVVEETGEVAVKILVGSVQRSLDSGLLVSARTSTGTIDFTEYDCILVQVDGTWEVEECVDTITT